MSSDVIPDGYTAIYTAEDLDNIRNNLSGKYILMNDIDLSGYDNWEPIGTAKNVDMDPETGATILEGEFFTGTLDGNGHTISNLGIEGTREAGGLFSGINNADIRNLQIINASIYGENQSLVQGFTFAGILTGISVNSKITNLGIKGNLKGNVGYSGGLAGFAIASTISSSYADINIQSEFPYSGIGGFLGGSANNTITDCYSTGKVSGTVAAGFIGGVLGDSKISNSYSSTNISDSDLASGFIGSL